MIKLISKFPFIDFIKGSYQTIVMNDNYLTSKQRELIKFINGILSVDNISINKIRYVFTSSFLYDIDNNKINPVYQVMKPINFGRKKKPDIEIGKPENSITITFEEFVNIDDFEIIKMFMNLNKKGVVMYINENDFHRFVGIIGLNVNVENNL